MKSPISHINRSLTLKLCLGILGIVMLVLISGLGFLFQRSRQIVLQEATERATHILDNTTLRVTNYLEEVETATENISWLALRHQQPDSLFSYTRRVVEQNPNINGCSITMEPGIFPQHGRDFSVYTLRIGDKIETAIEAPYNYYEKVWYKTARQRGTACWVDPYNDYNEGTLSSPVMIASYCKPMYTPQGDPLGVIATDLSIEKLTHALSDVKPYPHSYCMLLGSDGHYYVHPDRLKLIRQSILTAHNPKTNPDIATLAKEMTTGKTGHMQIHLDGNPSHVFYQPVPHTGWSIALVCPQADILADYQPLTYILLIIIPLGLLLMLLICWKTIQHFIAPLDQLAQESHHIAQGDLRQDIPTSHRSDVVGDLQNSFVAMQDTIDQHIGNIQKMNAETEKRNNQLAKANQLAEEMDRNKTTFVREVLLQIRTPLNIIAGFMQVMRDTYSTLPTEEAEKSIDTMKQGATTVKRMASMLLDASWKGERQALDLTKEVELNAVVEDCIKDFKEKTPREVALNHTSNLPRPYYIHTNRLYLHRTVRELLYNAKKFASENSINFIVEATPTHIRFTIEDHGPGIPEEDRERVFEPFFKHDHFSEGLGLGLGLTRVNIQNLNGTLTLDTNYTEGTRFIIEIPNQ